MSAGVVEMERDREATGVRQGAVSGPMDRVYFLHVWALMVTGVIFVFSASFPTAGRPDALMLPGDPYHYLFQHLQYVAIALVAMLLTSLVPPRVVRTVAPWAFAGGALLMGLALFSPWGVTLGGAKRWLDLPGLPAFQPSEMMKIAFIILLAHFLARKDEGRDEAPMAFGWVLLLVGIVGGMLLMQRDQGMATIYAAIAFSLLLFGGMSLWKLVPMAASAIAGGLIFAYLEPYRWRRIMAFIDLENAPADDRYHILNMLIAQARGGVTGMGLGMSPDKWRSLPAPHTDSIFSVIGSEMGLIGGLAVLVVVGLLAWRGLHIARRSSSAYGFYVAAGVAVMLCVQSIAHIAVNTSCMPVTGLTLPFISGGGTSLLSASIGAGLVLGVSRRQRRGES
ncbi:MAG: FtsW/RodA/SpoVE family cell cycle protein [Armatimonadota bacterium]|jgi:cell division protein FtsW